MPHDLGRKGKMSKYTNKKLEQMINLFGLEDTALKIGVSCQGLYKNLTARKYKSKLVYFLPPDPK